VTVQRVVVGFCKPVHFVVGECFAETFACEGGDVKQTAKSALL